MDSIENLFSYMTPARLMIKIWEYSNHVLHVSPETKVSIANVKSI